MALYDVYAAQAFYEAATRRGVGQEVSL